jgi:hypothetical protein
MPRSQQPPLPDRRRFLKAAGLAGIGTALVPHMVAFAQTPTPPPSGAMPAKPDSAAAPAAPPEISEDARSLGEIIRRRYGKHLNNDQLEAVTRELDGRLRGGKAMRDVKLANGDEPDFTFHP